MSSETKAYLESVKRRLRTERTLFRSAIGINATTVWSYHCQLAVRTINTQAILNKRGVLYAK